MIHTPNHNYQLLTECPVKWTATQEKSLARDFPVEFTDESPEAFASRTYQQFLWFPEVRVVSQTCFRYSGCAHQHPLLLGRVVNTCCMTKTMSFYNGVWIFANRLLSGNVVNSSTAASCACTLANKNEYHCLIFIGYHRHPPTGSSNPHSNASCSIPKIPGTHSSPSRR